MTQKTKLIVTFLDFDGTMMDCPTPEEGKYQYELVHNTPYPHQGWWSKKESLCLTAFDIQPFYKMDKVVKTSMSEPDQRTILLTNRLGKLEHSVRAVLDKHNYVMDLYTFMHGPDNKGQRIRKILDTHFPNATEAAFYDDDVRHLRDARDAMRGHRVPLKLFMVERGEIIPFK